MQSSNSSSTPTLPLPAVTVSELFYFFATRASLFFKFFRFRHVPHVIVKPVGATDSDSDSDDDDDKWLELFHTEDQWSEAEQIKQKKKPVQRWKIVSKPATCKFTPFLRRCGVACEPERHSNQESGGHLLPKTQKWRLKRLRPLWPLHRTRRWLVISCDRYCRTANRRPLIVKKTLFKYATSFHEMENFPWCASPRAFNDTKFERHRQC